MSDSPDKTSSESSSFTETTTESWGSRLANSLIATLVGLVLVPAAVILPFWNEGRAVDAIRALDRGAGSVVEVSADAATPSGEGKLVHLSGLMAPATPARDPVFGVSAEGLLRLSRTVEMYQWAEESKSDSQGNVGGSKTTTTTYTYKRDWADHAIDSSRFKQSSDHRNPAMPQQSASFSAGGVKLGVYRVDEPILRELSATVPLTPKGVPPAGYRPSDDGFYRGQNPASPAVGDVRVTFKGASAQVVSVVAAVAGGMLTSYKDGNGYEIALLQPGAVSAAAMFAEAKQAESILTWILRALGFVLVLVGLVCITRPLTMLFAVLPFLETIVGAGAFLAALTFAVPITLVTIAVAWMVYRPLIGLLLLGAAAAGMFLFGRIGRRRQAPAPA